MLDPDMIRSLLDQAPKTEAAEQSYFTNKLIELDDDEKDTDIGKKNYVNNYCMLILKFIKEGSGVVNLRIRTTKSKCKN